MKCYFVDAGLKRLSRTNWVQNTKVVWCFLFETSSVRLYKSQRDPRKFSLYSLVPARLAFPFLVDSSVVGSMSVGCTTVSSLFRWLFFKIPDLANTAMKFLTAFLASALLTIQCDSSPFGFFEWIQFCLSSSQLFSQRFKLACKTSGLHFKIWRLVWLESVFYGLWILWKADQEPDLHCCDWLRSGDLRVSSNKINPDFRRFFSGDSSETQDCGTNRVVCLYPSNSCCDKNYKKMIDWNVMTFVCMPKDSTPMPVPARLLSSTTTSKPWS